jgi:hypothetical protein
MTIRGKGTVIDFLNEPISTFDTLTIDVRPAAIGWVEDYWSSFIRNPGHGLGDVQLTGTTVWVTLPDLQYRNMILQLCMYDIRYDYPNKNHVRLPVAWYYADMYGNKYTFNRENNGTLPLSDHTRAFVDYYDAINYLITIDKNQDGKPLRYVDELKYMRLREFLVDLKSTKPECFL